MRSPLAVIAMMGASMMGSDAPRRLTYSKPTIKRGLGPNYRRKGPKRTNCNRGIVPEYFQSSVRTGRNSWAYRDTLKAYNRAMSGSRGK